MKSKLYALLAVVSLCCLIGWTGYGQNRRQMSAAWEYKVVNNPSEVSLNELGAQGWELVSIAAYGDPSTGYFNAAYFKRAK
ncbi:MAG: DUF4177 domain-containing protein [Acidobacteriota bacterium]|nr:DUF4177 domain-containing protein [Acidobacteriota bacterium]